MRNLVRDIRSQVGLISRDIDKEPPPRLPLPTRNCFCSDILGLVLLSTRHARMQISLASQSAIVTGSGRGIGRAIAHTLAQAGASVLLTDIDEAALEDAKIAIKAAVPSARLSSIAGDITAANFPDALITRTLTDFGSARHHRQQRRLHLGQRHSEDHRRAVSSHARYPRRRALPRPALRFSVAAGNRQEGNRRPARP